MKTKKISLMAAKKGNLEFSLSNIRTIQFAKFSENLPKTETVKQQLEFAFGTNMNSETIGCIINFSLSGDNTFLMIEVACHFDFTKGSWKALVADSKVELKVPVMLAHHLASVTLGTARGILHDKTEQTEFNRFPIPLVQLNEVFVEDVIVRLAPVPES